MLLIGVAVDPEKPRHVSVKIEHSWLVLCREDNRLYGHRGKIRDKRTQLLQHGLGVRDIGDDELRHPSEQRDRLVRIAASGLLKIKHDRQIITLAQFLAKGVEYGLTLICEAAEDQYRLGSNRVDHVPYLLVMEQQVDELRDLKVIDGDGGLVQRRYDQVLLLGALQF